MKNIELKSLAEYFGTQLPAGKIADRETRIAIVRLYGSLAKANKEVADEIEQNRKSLVEGHEEEIQKYAELLRKGDEASVKEAEAMTECVRIDKDFQEASAKIYDEESCADIKKVPLEVLYEALCDCKFPNLKPEIPIAVVEEIFKSIIL